MSAFLDPPDAERDAADAHRIAFSIAGLRRHQLRHQAFGHGFGFTLLTGSKTRIPVITWSYHKINSGPFVETPLGPRLLRLPELGRIRGHRVGTSHYATGVEALGQGVLTQVFESVFFHIKGNLTRKRG